MPNLKEKEVATAEAHRHAPGTPKRRTSLTENVPIEHAASGGWNEEPARTRWDRNSSHPRGHKERC